MTEVLRIGELLPDGLLFEISGDVVFFRSLGQLITGLFGKLFVRGTGGSGSLTIPGGLFFQTE